MPKVVDHDSYRKELLNRCLALFAERGYGSVTMRQIARELQVSTGTLYHYFPSKEGIFIQLIQELCEKDIDTFFAQAPASESLRERLQAVTNFFLENYTFYQQQLLLWVEFYQQTSRTATKQPHILSAFWQRTQKQLVSYLQLPTEKVDFLLLMMDGLLLQCLYDRQDADQAWMVGQLEQLVRSLENS